MGIKIITFLFYYLTLPRMPISSNSFFHFINKGKNVLPLILENGFRTSASDEVVPYGGDDPIFMCHCIPMVCFCDIPLSLVDKHAQFYCGHQTEIFGLGMKRAWGLNSNLNPVSYINDKSELHNLKHYQSKLYNQVTRFVGKNIFEDLALGHISPSMIPCASWLPDGREVETFLPRTMLYDKFVDSDYYRLKVIEGAEPNKIYPYLDYFSVTEDHNFYNEREWRYVHKDLQDIISFQTKFMDKQTLEDFQQKGHVFDTEAANNAFHHYLTAKATFEPTYLPFTVDDIDVIIVDSDESQIALVEKIENGYFTKIGGSIVDKETAKKLITKLISYDFIKNNV